MHVSEASARAGRLPCSHGPPGAPCALDLPELSGPLFGPRTRRFADPFVVAGDGFELACHRSVRDPARPTVVCFHGPLETVADLLHSTEPWLLALGVNVLLVEYRGCGMSSGVPALGAMLADVELVVEAAGLEPGRLIFHGRSVGGLFAVHGAWRYPRAAGLVLEGAPAEPLALLEPLAEEAGLELVPGALAGAVSAHLDQRAKLAGFRGRTLVLHGRHDRVVPSSHGEQLLRWAPEPREGLFFERGDHHRLLAANPTAYVRAVEGLVRAAV